MPYDQRERWNDPEEATRHAHEDHQTTIWTSMPCIIKEHNVQDNTAKVQIAIKLKHVDEKGKATWVPFPILEDVPVHYYGGGGVTITPPIKDGDEGRYRKYQCTKYWDLIDFNPPFRGFSFSIEEFLNAYSDNDQNHNSDDS
jgi:hypothetical protein